MSTALPLFSKCPWHQFVETRRNDVTTEISRYDGNKLLNTPVDDLAAYFAEAFGLDVPTLLRDSAIADQREVQVPPNNHFRFTPAAGPSHVPGIRIEVCVPFTGSVEAFAIQPSTFGLTTPRAGIHDSQLILEIVGSQLERDEVQKHLHETLDHIDNCLTVLKKDAAELKARLFTIAKQEIETRRDRLLKNQNLVASLGFPLKKNDTAPATFAAPNVRRKLKPSPPTASSEPYQPEAALSDADYEHILDVIQRMAQVIERSPRAFVEMKEEEIRTQFLVALNGHYDGEATGETFNFEGKTDILVRSNGRNVFIGECKFWGGAKQLIATLDQILSYSSWRDTKVAVLIFNRNKDLSKVLESIEQTVPTHPNFKRSLGKHSETAFRYAFSHRDDASREMIVAVLVFEVPS